MQNDTKVKVLRRTVVSYLYQKGCRPRENTRRLSNQKICIAVTVPFVFKRCRLISFHDHRQFFGNSK